MKRTWRGEAACSGVDPSLFMPLGKGRAPVDAMRVCVSCPVRSECLTMALEDNDPSCDLGVFGGTTARARSKVRAGAWSVGQAMAHGDQMAARRTAAERRAA